ncbi:hypothetical protein F4679DRAFT_581345 [Xylaria curta]|nr:hypothetical protein F4679DRAFT_581345 [Xylaria curta]
MAPWLRACEAEAAKASTTLSQSIQIHTLPHPSTNMSASPPAFSSSLNSGQFDWLGKIGATREAIATLNDQPYVFFVLVAALVILILEGVFIWYIHYATMKPEQKKKKEKKKDEKKPGGKPPAQR